MASRFPSELPLSDRLSSTGQDNFEITGGDEPAGPIGFYHRPCMPALRGAIDHVQRSAFKQRF